MEGPQWPDGRISISIGANPKVERRPPIIWPFFRNCMKMRNIGPRGESPRPLRLPKSANELLQGKGPN